MRRLVSKLAGPKEEHVTSAMGIIRMVVLVISSLSLVACSSKQGNFRPELQNIGPCPRANLVDGGLVNFEGEMSRTKGAQLTVQGPETPWAIVSIEAAIKKQKWRGRRVRISGRRCTYRCGLQEQCVTSGSIPYVKNVALDVWDNGRWVPVITRK